MQGSSHQLSTSSTFEAQLPLAPVGSHGITRRLGAWVAAAAFLLALTACSTGVAPETTESAILAYEAEGAEITNGVFVMVTDVPASAQAALMQPSSIAASLEAAEDAYIDIEIPHANNWTLWSRVRADASSGDAVYVGFDGHLEKIRSEVVDAYVWVPVAARHLTPGGHRISLGHADAELMVDLLVVTDRELSSSELESWRATNASPASPAPTIEPQPMPTEP